MCNRVGVPEIILSYINHTYKDCSTCLKYKCGRSPSIPVNRGVKQGDLISHILFNSVIDYATSKMTNHNEVSINNLGMILAIILAI